MAPFPLKEGRRSVPLNAGAEPEAPLARQQPAAQEPVDVGHPESERSQLAWADTFGVTLNTEFRQLDDVGIAAAPAGGVAFGGTGLFGSLGPSRAGTVCDNAVGQLSSAVPGSRPRANVPHS
jgi:hypothetical protein